MEVFVWILLSFFAAYCFAVIAALSVNAKLKKENYDGIPWSDCFRIKKILSVIFGWILSTFVPRETMQQFAIRFTNEECNECYRVGRCIHAGKRSCGCDPYKMACSPWEGCRKGNWGPIMSVLKWKELKEKEREFLKNQKNIK